MSDRPSAASGSGSGRHSIDVEGFAHQNPIPAGSRMGPLLTTSIIGPFDPGARTVPEDLATQVANLFHHAGLILAAAGGGWEHVVKMTFYVRELAFREAINVPWVERFPDPTSRPARHSQLSSEPGPALVRCDLLAYIV